MKKWSIDTYGCLTCLGASYCDGWKDELKVPENGIGCIRQDGKYYADREEVEGYLAMLRGMAIDETEPEITGGSFIACSENIEAVPEFRVGDEVFSLSSGNGIIVSIINDSRHSITVKFFSSGEHGVRTMNGKLWDSRKRRDLYHGHDLEVSVKEKLPVRPKKTREAWVVLTSTYDPGHISHFEFKTELAAIDYCTKYFGIILSNPIKVEVPE